MSAQDKDNEIPQSCCYEFNRQPLPYLDRKKMHPESYVSERLNRIRKEREKISLKKYEEMLRQDMEVEHESKKNIIVSPNKVMNTQTIIASYDPFRKQLQSMRKKPAVKVNYEQLLNNLHPFSNAIQEFGVYHMQNQRQKLQRQELLKKKRRNDESKRNLYRSLNKKDEERQYHSNNELLNNEESFFLNIGKMSLLENNGQKVLYNNRKSKVSSSAFMDRQPHNISITYVGDNDIEEELNIDRFQLHNDEITIQNTTQVKNKKIIDIIDKNIQRAETIDTSLLLQKHHHAKSQLIQAHSEASESPLKPNKIKRAYYASKKFKIPFEKYYYRLLLWKVNYSNKILIEVPQTYEHRLKIYIGKGNNSSLVRGLIKRRIWLGITDRIQQANFVWTQLKSLPYYRLQQPWQPQHQQKLQETMAQSQCYKQFSLFSKPQLQQFDQYMKKYRALEQRSDERFQYRNKNFKFERIIKGSELKNLRVQNHLMNNYVIGNKKALFHTMSGYYKSINKEVFDYLPLTFHIKDGLEDPIYFQFLKYFYAKAKKIKASTEVNQNKKKLSKNIWIVKPGQNSNRGNGIKVCLTLEEIKAILKKKEIYADGTYRTYILQQYIENPLLYKKRKFDIRHFMMISSVNGKIKGYWYQDGYARTTSSQYTLKQGIGAIHLTNDAVQKNLPDYGKYQKGNKLSYDELDEYIKKKNPKVSYRQNILPKIKQITADIIRAASSIIDPMKLQNNFELYGLDFMLDSDLKLYLIQVNSNPCLEISCPLLGAIIPRMIENLLELTMDPLFPPPVQSFMKGVHYEKNLEEWNRFELVYDETVEGRIKFENSEGIIDVKLLEEEDDTFQDDGEQWDETD